MATKAFETDIPARMDRLPWSRFHWLVIVALGITWMLDGLEVTLVGAMGGTLTSKGTLDFSSSQVGLIGTFYVIGAVIGALGFGYLTDRYGRKKLFFITLAVYMLGTLLTAFSWNIWSFLIFRAITGSGIGGEYSAVNSAIDELIPARVRGFWDLVINGSYWVGAAVGAASTLFFLNTSIFDVNLGWRLAFVVGAVLALLILFFRRSIPESPRWLMTHDKKDEADEVMEGIEERVRDSVGEDLPQPDEDKGITIHPRGTIGFVTIARTMFVDYPRRTVLSMSLMVSQAFFYNAIFFTYALLLTEFYDVSNSSVGLYLLPFAAGNFFGPLVLGRFFDTWGRRQMISLTYMTAAILLAVTGYMFAQGWLSALTQTISWSVIFFFASAGASSAYLTVSEIFPLETRAMAIAFFYATGTAAGGIVSPWLFGTLIGTGNRMNVMYGYLIGAALMGGAAVVEIFWGVKAEGESLEDVAKPLSATEDD